MLNMVPNLRCQPKKELDFYLKSIAPSHSVIPLQSYDFFISHKFFEFICLWSVNYQ